MNRCADWEARLCRFVTGKLRQPFRWGETDCATLVWGGLAAMYPAPLLPALPYRSLRGAKECFSALGRDVPAWLAQYGGEHVKRPFLQAGDVVLLPDAVDGLPGLGIAPSSSQVLLSGPDLGPNVVDARFVPDDAGVWRPPL